nr:MAG TPA: hypothetical protein [Caudoviricetes sp.]
MCAGRGHNCKLQENLRKCCRLTAFAGVLHSFLALERNKIIFLLRWMIVVQDCLQNDGCGVRGAKAIAGAAMLGGCRAIARLRCVVWVAVRMLRLRSEFR